MNKHMKITHEEVGRALAKFRKQGGLIHKLPDTPTVRESAVRGRFGSLRDLAERGDALGALQVAD